MDRVQDAALRRINIDQSVSMLKYKNNKWKTDVLRVKDTIRDNKRERDNINGSEHDS